MQNLMLKITPVLAKIRDRKKAMTAVSYFLQVVQNSLKLDDQTLINLIKKKVSQEPSGPIGVPATPKSSEGYSLGPAADGSGLPK